MIRKLATSLGSRRTRSFVVIAAVLVGICARVFLATLGHNHDFEAYQKVSEIRLDGHNVYASTALYNYGPGWFLIIEGLRHIANLVPALEWQRVFRLELALLLSVADLGISLLLARRYGVLRGIAFFLTPIAVLISGYHGQFDNIAVLLAFGGVVLWSKGTPNSELTARQLTGALLIGGSLIVKHLVFLLPIWLALRTSRNSHRAVIIGVPYLMFASSFLPFLGGGGLQGVVDNVILYDSAANAPIWTLIGLNALATPLFVSVLLVGGFLTRRLEIVDALGVYLVLLVVASPAVVNQYLAIPLVLLVARSNVFAHVYVGISTLLILGHHDGLGIQWFDDLFPFSLQFPTHHQWQVYLIPVVLLALAGATSWRQADRENRGRMVVARGSLLAP